MKKIIILTAILLFAVCVAAPSSSGKYFTCTSDCPTPAEEFGLKGCSILVNGEVKYQEGLVVPDDAGHKGYAEKMFQYETDEVDKIIYTENISCEYWKKSFPLPGEEVNETITPLIVPQPPIMPPPMPPVNFTPPPLPPMPVLINAPVAEETGNAEVEMEQGVNAFNENMGSLPSQVQSLIGEENIHVFFTYLDGSEVDYGAVTEGGVIVRSDLWIDEDNNGKNDVWEGEGIKTTMNLYFDEGAIQRLANSETPIADFEEMWGKEIRIEGQTVGTKMKNFFAGIGIMIASWFE